MTYRGNLLCLLVITLTLLSNNLNSNVPDLKVPDLFNGIHDQYSHNYVSTSMTARGNTGIAIPDRINTSLNNPATYRGNKTHFSFEFLVKDGEKEYNIIDSHKRKRYESPFPLSFVGLGFKTVNNFNYGVSYSLVKSIEYSSFYRSLFGTGAVDYYPTYKEHQLTFTLNRNFGNFTIGINNNLVIQNFDDYRNEGKVDRIYFNEVLYRPQIGFLYETAMINLGGSFTPKTEKNIGEKYILLDAVYPTSISGGVSVKPIKDLVVNFDVDHIKYSETSNLLDDRTTLKFGLEKMISNYTLKVGLINSPSVFEGEYKIDNYSAPELNEFHPAFYSAIPEKGLYKNTDQMLLTFGVSFNFFKLSNLHLAYLTDVSGNTNRSQFMTSLDFDLDLLKYIKKN